MKIVKVALHELDEFVKSDLYNQFETKPITPLRAASYLRNPNAKPGDNVLYMMLNRYELIAFRTIFADKLTKHDEPFVWLSGNWVHPEHRRKGHSEKLLDEIYNDQKGRLMFTNYAPASLQLYLKTNKFNPIYSAKGTRFYLFAKPSKLLNERMPGWKFVLFIFDFLISIRASIKTALYKPEQITEQQIETIEQIDEECYELIKSNQDYSIFRRNKKNFKWIFSNPWISTHDKRFQKNYPFSSFSKSFRYETLKVYSNHKLSGFLFYSIRDRHLKTLYHLLTNESKKIIGKYLSNLAVSEKFELMTILDPELANAVKSCKHPFIHQKDIEHQIYSSFEIKNLSGEIQSGDGDFIFS